MRSISWSVLFIHTSTGSSAVSAKRDNGAKFHRMRRVMHWVEKRDGCIGLPVADIHSRSGKKLHLYLVPRATSGVIISGSLVSSSFGRVNEFSKPRVFRFAATSLALERSAPIPKVITFVL